MKRSSNFGLTAVRYSLMPSSCRLFQIRSRCGADMLRHVSVSPLTHTFSPRVSDHPFDPQDRSSIRYSVHAHVARSRPPTLPQYIIPHNTSTTVPSLLSSNEIPTSAVPTPWLPASSTLIPMAVYVSAHP
ncbi:hypothetical protein N657DRAFT_445242 [Parathielavia appendiculata]|uniref:Uncharacterized protein n=1 Tax=Parathielavia appendiculata TaxID=2587402 RepID=A0AAN6TYC3_9PEZI|nr:hypothetical protein N657DRAFT_445242 [Parathielavia appendiculata]